MAKRKEHPLHKPLQERPLQPFFIILVQPVLIVIDEHACRDVHRVHQAQPFLNAALKQAFVHLWGDVDKPPPLGDIEP